MNNSPAAEFLRTFDAPYFPAPIAGRFEVMECLGETNFSETYLLRENKNLYVLKIQRDLKTAGTDEAELLRGLSHAGLPESPEVTEKDGSRYMLRKYAEGEPLNTAAITDLKTVLLIMTKLCDVLEYLHSQSPPIIHRDIKPSNIIFDPKTNAVTLIDFGISRKFSEESENDTVYLGTQKFAPPEQYGFAQTDHRSDIFSLGVVMRFCLTGTASQKAEIKDKHLAKIIAKCTEIAPNTRYQTAAAVKKALYNCQNRVKRRATAAIACAFAAVLITIAAIFLNINAPQLPFFEITQDEMRELAQTRETEFLRAHGNPVLSFIEGEGLKVSHRNDNWDSLTFNVSRFPPGYYILEVEFASDDADAVFELGFVDGPPWGVFANTSDSIIRYELALEYVNGEVMANVVSFLGIQTHLSKIQLQTYPVALYGYNPDFIIRSIRLFKNI